jgi:hypothetical protein
VIVIVIDCDCDCDCDCDLNHLFDPLKVLFLSCLCDVICLMCLICVI